QRNIIYNQDQKPVHITYNGGVTDLTYDGAGERIKKVKGSETVVYVGAIYEIRDGQAMSHIFANGQKIVTLAGNKEYYSHSDHLGSTSIVTDENGTVVEEIGYLPFGATLFRNTYNGSSWESAYRFTGQEFDDEYHLYNYNARLYDPIMSRFITPDTIVPQPYNPQSLNRYSYCLNNPLMYTDPSGHSAEGGHGDEDDEWVLDDIVVTAKASNADYYTQGEFEWWASYYGIPEYMWPSLYPYGFAGPWYYSGGYPEVGVTHSEQNRIIENQTQYIRERVPDCNYTKCDECSHTTGTFWLRNDNKIGFYKDVKIHYGTIFGMVSVGTLIEFMHTYPNMPGKNPLKYNPFDPDPNDLFSPFKPEKKDIVGVIWSGIPMYEKQEYRCYVEVCTDLINTVEPQRHYCRRTDNPEINYEPGKRVTIISRIHGR
ncbi:MAG: RHS repeat-associated core domain-containing protein, partial [Bacteroidales bacterium]|nr:RHS repeat-associated core domain-containing protein [Bacteroidales bacterium]